MKRWLVYVVAVIALAGGLGKRLFAQRSQAVATASAKSHVDRVADMALSHPVTLTVEHVSLRTAIESLAAVGHIQVEYQSELVNAYTAPVTIRLTRVPLEQAFERMLAGTRLSLVPIERTRFGLAAIGGEGGNSVASGIIEGLIRDARTRQPLRGGTVVLDDATRGVQTDEHGWYRLVAVAAGRHVVRVRMIGYVKTTQAVTVVDGEKVTADVALEPSTNVLDQVVVTGTVAATELKAVPNAMTIITAKDIERRGITHIDQLFRGEVPGIFAVEQGTAAYLGQVVMFSRGPTRIEQNGASAFHITNPIKTYVDGVEMADPQFLAQIDPKSIERIEILAGPQASTIYGANAINGVMQIFTKRGSTVKPTVTLNASGGFAQNNVSSALTPSYVVDGSLSGAEGATSYTLGSSWNYTGSWSPGNQLQRVSVYGGARRAIGPLAVDASVRQGWTGNRVRGTFNIFRITPTYAVINGAGVATPSHRSLDGRTLGLTTTYVPWTWWSHQFTIGSDASNTSFIGGAPGFSSISDTAFQRVLNTNTRISQAYSSTLRIPVAPVTRLVLSYGADHWRDRNPQVSWYINPAGTTFATGVNPRVLAKNRGAYVQGQLGWWDAVFLTYGVRADWNPDYGTKAKVRPGRYGVSFAQELGPVTAKLRGSYGRSIRPPDAGMSQGYLSSNSEYVPLYGAPLYDIAPNVDLGPEFQQGGEGGLELYVVNRVSVTMTRYNQTIDGLISNVYRADSVQALQPGVDNAVCYLVSQLGADGYCYYIQSEYLNIGSIRNQGWEFTGSVNTGPFTTQGTYSWIKSRVIGVTPRYRALLTDQGYTPGRSFDYAPEHLWAINVSYAHGNTSMNVNVNGVGTTLRASNAPVSLITTDNLRLRTYEAATVTLPNGFRQPVAGYSMTNVNASQRFSRLIDGTLQVTNLMNFYRNDSNASNPVLGRQTRFGLRVRWE